MNIVIITGASSGIGMEFARQSDPYLRKIDEFWLVARREEKLEELAKKLSHKTRIFSIDLTDEAKIQELADAVKENHGVVRMLINCAGYGIMGDFASGDWKSETGMITLNCTALTSLTHRLIPFMKSGSRIIQMASSAAFLPQPDFAVYAATKAYVLSFSRALGQELAGRGIIVTSVCPGPVDTPFFDIAEKSGHTLRIKKYFMADADAVVKKALRDSLHKSSISVYGASINGLMFASKILPHQFFLTGMKALERLQRHSSQIP